MRLRTAVILAANRGIPLALCVLVLPITVPPGTQSNKLLRLAGKAMPKPKGAGSGDEYVRLIGTLPTNLTDK